MKSFDLAVFREAIAAGRIEWRKHVLQKLAERGMAQQAVRDVLLKGERGGSQEARMAKNLPSPLRGVGARRSLGGPGRGKSVQDIQLTACGGSKVGGSLTGRMVIGNQPCWGNSPPPTSKLKRSLAVSLPSCR